MRTIVCIVIIACFCVFPQPAPSWNLLPLAAESPQTLSSGTFHCSLGVQYLKNKNFPFSPFSKKYDRDVLSLPTLGFRIGLGTRTELHLTYEVLFIEEEEFQIREVWKSGDLAFFTKIRILTESSSVPGFGLKIGAKLPNARDPYRVGTDETDLAFLALGEKSFSSLTLTSNFGLLILGNPFKNASQDDLLSYSLAIKIPWHEQFSLTTEIAGQAFGTNHNENASALLHLNFYDNRLTWNLSGRVGLLDNSEAWGFSGGVSVTLGRYPWSANACCGIRRLFC